MRDRLLIVGWDGADWDILRPLMDQGELPTLSSMVEEGATADLLSTIPYQSWSAWSTFLTGLGPAGHGVYDFVERDPTHPERRVPVPTANWVSLCRTSLIRRPSCAACPCLPDPSGLERFSRSCPTRGTRSERATSR